MGAGTEMNKNLTKEIEMIARISTKNWERARKFSDTCKRMGMKCSGGELDGHKYSDKEIRTELKRRGKWWIKI